MDTRSRQEARSALVATVATALRQSTRRSVHPADLAALRQAATRIAAALEAEFTLVSRHSSAAELTDRHQVSAPAHK